jgi:2-methylisocitrate lyase-like PEP mutase family enzyme
MTYLAGSSLADQPAGIRFRELLKRPGILADARDMAHKVAAAAKARRHLYVIARTDAASELGRAGLIDTLDISATLAGLLRCRFTAVLAARLLQ